MEVCANNSEHLGGKLKNISNLLLIYTSENCVMLNHLILKQACFLPVAPSSPQNPPHTKGASSAAAVIRVLQISPKSWKLRFLLKK